MFSQYMQAYTRLQSHRTTVSLYHSVTNLLQPHHYHVYCRQASYKLVTTTMFFCMGSYTFTSYVDLNTL